MNRPNIDPVTFLSSRLVSAVGTKENAATKAKRNICLIAAAAAALSTPALLPGRAAAVQSRSSDSVTTTIQVVATGLNVPRGLVYDPEHGRILIAEAGVAAGNTSPGQPYQLDQPRSAAELAKDVAALANMSGGVIVVGLRTRKAGSSEVIDEVRPVPAGLIDRDRHRKLVRERVFPFVRDSSTWWIAVGDERGLLVIDVPAQAPKDKPFIVSGSDGTHAAVDGNSAAVPLRDDDGTHWLSGQELHRLLTGGWNVSGPPAPRVVIAPSPATPAIAVGEGDPLWAEEFREAYGAAGRGAALGVPDGPVSAAGPGVMQQLSGGTRGPAAVFAVPDAKPVILAGDAWRFFLKQSRDASPADYPALAGLPVADQTSSGQRIIRLSGGGWGPGELIQDQPGDTLAVAAGSRRGFDPGAASGPLVTDGAAGDRAGSGDPRRCVPALERRFGLAHRKAWARAAAGSPAQHRPVTVHDDARAVAGHRVSPARLGDPV